MVRFKNTYVQTFVRSIVQTTPPPLCNHFGLNISTFGLGPQPGDLSPQNLMYSLPERSNISIYKTNMLKKRSPFRSRFNLHLQHGVINPYSYIGGFDSWKVKKGALQLFFAFLKNVFKVNFLAQSKIFEI